jgi:Zn-dependent protease
MSVTQIALFIIIFLYSVILHEIAHGVVAERLGDPTARFSGRITLNPIPHIDIFGSVLLPIMMYLAFGVPFGYAKAVPVNYMNLRNFRRDMVLVALAGPATNFILAIMAGIVLRLFPGLPFVGVWIFAEIVVINLVLGVFNLIPLPPLDGSKVLSSILGYFNHRWQYLMLEFERYGFIVIILLSLTGFFSSVLTPIISNLSRIITGHSLI